MEITITYKLSDREIETLEEARDIIIDLINELEFKNETLDYKEDYDDRTFEVLNGLKQTLSQLENQMTVY